ncbi:hypothetical protein ARMGADRAFT_1028764 [Armillaria gallica]|uniref:Uncharacterized protein n=1 Tax=Armillaria gallica TaxID=47427 RepID=A0A2H3DNH0_ARMGA|nr:hypothetical protein ARMGADRAFT_1028764 [Armillaria gallica]
MRTAPLLPDLRAYSDGLLYWQHLLQYLFVLELLEELLAAVRERLDTIDIGVYTDVHSQFSAFISPSNRPMHNYLQNNITVYVRTKLVRPAIALATAAVKGDIPDPSSMEDRILYLTSSTGGDVIPDALGRLATWNFQLTAKEAKFSPSVSHSESISLPMAVAATRGDTATPLKSGVRTWRIRSERSDSHSDRAVTQKTIRQRKPSGSTPDTLLGRIPSRADSSEFSKERRK